MTQDEWEDLVKQSCHLLATEGSRIPPNKAEAFRDALMACVLEGGSCEFQKLAKVAEECRKVVSGT